MIFFNEMVNLQHFPKLTGGLDKGGLDNVEYGTTVSELIPIEYIMCRINAS